VYLYLFQGLAIEKGYACALCPQAGRSRESLRKHHSQFHPDQPCPQSWISCSIQRLTSAIRGVPRSAHAWFRVLDSTLSSGPSSNMLLEGLQEQMGTVLEDPHQPTMTDHRSISPWLLTTRWHEHINGYHIKELIDLIAFPKEAEFPRLKEVVIRYFQEATDLLPSLSELTRQILNSEDPLKQYVTVS
jgi:hypothetical protein